jgi:hypothetical protein
VCGGIQHSHLRIVQMLRHPLRGSEVLGTGEGGAHGWFALQVEVRSADGSTRPQRRPMGMDAA